MNNSKSIRIELEALKKLKHICLCNIQKQEKQKEELREEEESVEEALDIVRKVAKHTQNSLQSRISSLTTSCLESIFGKNAYKLDIDFVEARGKTECVISLVDREGNKVSPLDSVGGGVVDVCAFALRIVLWGIEPKRKRSLLILDEPFRFLSKNLHEKASALLSKLSQSLGLQIIMVSHSEELTESGDKVFYCKKRNGESYIEEYQN